MDLLLIVLPAFLIFTTGYIGQKILKLNVRSISTMALYLMIPFLTFDTFYQNQLNMNYFFLFLFSLLLLIILAVITFLYGKIIKADKVHMSAMLLGGIFSNSGNYGVPVALFAFGSLAFYYAVIIMVIHALLINTIGLFIASYGGGQSTTIKTALHSVIKMPVLYGIVAGIGLQLLHVEIPPTIVEGISMVGAASVPTVMLILGMQLAEIKPQKFEWKYVNTVVVIRMIASPLIATFLVMFMPVDAVIKSVFILLAAMPVAANTTMLSIQFDCKPDFVSFTTLVTTIISIITIPVTLFFLGV